MSYLLPGGRGVNVLSRACSVRSSLHRDCHLLFALLFGVISLLYATVGQAGGTAFLALMAFAAFPPTEMRPTALALNIVAAAYSTWVFNRNKVVDWRKLRPLLLSSLPTALAGGLIVLDERVYKTTTGIVLFLAGAATILRREFAVHQDRETPFLGAVSVGGGCRTNLRPYRRCRLQRYRPPSFWQTPRLAWSVPFSRGSFRLHTSASTRWLCWAAPSWVRRSV